MTTTRYMKSGQPPGHQPENRPLPEIDSRPAIVTAAAPTKRQRPVPCYMGRRILSVN